MSSDIDLGEIRRVLRHELVAIRGQWAWFLVRHRPGRSGNHRHRNAPSDHTGHSDITIGVLLLFGGIAQLVGAFWDPRAGAAFS